MSVNKVILLGNVGKDPEVRYLDTGIAVATFPFASAIQLSANGQNRQAGVCGVHCIAPKSIIA